MRRQMLRIKNHVDRSVYLYIVGLSFYTDFQVITYIVQIRQKYATIRWRLDPCALVDLFRVLTLLSQGKEEGKRRENWYYAKHLLKRLGEV